MQATLTRGQLLDVVRMNEALYVDCWGSPQAGLDIVHEIGGTNLVEIAGGYTGAGLRAEIMDQNLDEPHSDFAAAPPMRYIYVVATVHGATGRGGVCGKKGRVFNQRQHHRRPSTHEVTLTAGDRRMEVVTLDLSAGGFSFLTGEAIAEGAELTARFHHPPRTPPSRCVVRHCTPSDDGQYRIGVAFTPQS